MATYQLADKTERRNSTILARNRSLSFRTTFSSDLDGDDYHSIDSPTTAPSTGWGPEPIEETSEPEPSPTSEEDRELGGGDSDDTAAFGESPSLLTRALRRSPPHTPISTEDQQQQEEQQQQQPQDQHESRNGLGDGNGAYRGRIYRMQGASGRERSDSNAVFSDGDEDGDEARPSIGGGSTKRPKIRLSSAADGPSGGSSTATPQAPTESTPLLGGSVAANGSTDRSGYDLEGQKNTVRRRIMGIFGRRQDGSTRSPTVAAKAKIKKTYRSVTHIKWWDRRRLWENLVVAPIACLPAVIVGLLLNILDALSYGKCCEGTLHLNKMPWLTFH